MIHDHDVFPCGCERGMRDGDVRRFFNVAPGCDIDWHMESASDGKARQELEDHPLAGFVPAICKKEDRREAVLRYKTED